MDASEAELSGNQATTESDDLDDVHGPVNFKDRESLSELATLLEWDDGQTNDANHGTSSEAYNFDDPTLYPDEPEPLAEYDSELGLPLYDTDEDITGLSQKIKINEFVASVRPVTKDERQEITGMLEEFSVAKLRSWLPWLHKQDWVGHLLILFLKFRVYWEGNPHWWESSFWDRRLGCWRPTWSTYNLSPR